MQQERWEEEREACSHSCKEKDLCNFPPGRVYQLSGSILLQKQFVN